MKYSMRRQDGFHLIIVVIMIALLSVVGITAYAVINKTKTTPSDGPKAAMEDKTKDNPKTVEFVRWQFNDKEWSAMGTAPACEEPITIAAPIDLTKATTQLYPGQVRGGDFKPHGGLGLDGAASGQIEVRAMRDAYLYQGARYIEAGEMQYMLDFMDSCGIRYRYDHLEKLSADVMQLVDQLPEARVDDSRTTPFTRPVLFKTGALIAIAVGHPSNKNFGFDIGLYDLRKQNAVSQTDLYKSSQPRIQDKEQSFYAVCWYDYLPAGDKSLVKSLPPRGGAKESTSDYCTV